MLLLQHSCDVSRNMSANTNGRTVRTNVASGISCLVLPMSPSAAVQNQFSIGQAYDIYLDLGSDVQVGDKLTVGSDTYLVKGLMPYNVPVVGYLHASCIKEGS